MIAAHLDPSPRGVLADHATATIDIYRLEHADVSVGSTPDVLAPVSTIHVEKRFCNVNLALQTALGLPLPRDFAGPNRVDGCFPEPGEPAR